MAKRYGHNGRSPQREAMALLDLKPAPKLDTTQTPPAVH
jgi:hypothetical protein